MEEILNLEMALKNPPPEADSNELEKKVNKWVRIIATKIESELTFTRRVPSASSLSLDLFLRVISSIL